MHFWRRQSGSGHHSGEPRHMSNSRPSIYTVELLPLSTVLVSCVDGCHDAAILRVCFIDHRCTFHHSMPRHLFYLLALWQTVLFCTDKLINNTFTYYTPRWNVQEGLMPIGSKEYMPLYISRGFLRPTWSSYSLDQRFANFCKNVCTFMSKFVI